MTMKTPVIVSISGHRDSCDPERIKAQIAQRLCAIREGFLKKEKGAGVRPDIDPGGVRWIFLSPLAVGPDQWGAEVALQCGFELIVPLPMPMDLYKEDFSDQEWPQLELLKNRATQTLEIPLLAASKAISLRDNNGRYTEARNQQYAALGAFLFHYSDIMLFIWDGDDTQKAVGGTAYVKDYAVKGLGFNFPLPFHQPRLRPHPQKILWHLPVNRAKKREPKNTYEWQSININKRVVDDWIRHAALHDTWQNKISDEAKAQSCQYLTEKKRLPSDYEDILAAYAGADSAAIRAQAASGAWRQGILWTVLVSLACFAVLTGFPLSALGNYEHAPAWGYLAALTGAYALFLWKRGWWGKMLKLERAWDIQQLADGLRALAEGLRLQIFFGLAGINDFVGDYYPGKTPSELGWIIRKLRWHHLHLLASPPPVDMESVKKDWIDNQAAYFAKKSRDFARQAQRHERATQFFILTSVALTLLLVILWDSDFWVQRPFLEVWTLFLIGLTPALGAFVKVWSQVHGFQRNAEEYSRMEGVFSRAATLWETSDDEMRKSIVRELAKEALMENAEWHYYFRKEEVKPQ
jgi:hypothetical protein